MLEIDSKIQNKFFSMRDAFLSFDIDKSGEITESKFIEGICSMNADVTEDQIRALFKALDLDENGRISFEEFCRISQRKHLAKAPDTPDDFTVVSTKSRTHSIVGSVRSKSVIKVAAAPDSVSVRSNSVIRRKKEIDLIEVYDQVEMTLPSTRVKRRLKIAPSTGQPLPFDPRCRSQLSPTKYLPSIAEERETKVYG